MTFGSHQDLGAALFKTWSEEQQQAEIGKLVAGYRKGVPLGILIRMAETIAGSPEKAKEHLARFMTPKERRKAVDKEVGGMKLLAAEYLL